jgi:hypothetical protein
MLPTSPRHEGRSRSLCKRSPVAIYYKFDENFIEVLEVLNARQFVQQQHVADGEPEPAITRVLISRLYGGGPVTAVVMKE